MAANVPRPAPPFSINLPSGKKLPLEQYRGKVVALALVSTTCAHCQQLTQVLNRIQNDYAGKGVQVVMSAFEQGADKAVARFISTYRPNYPVGWNPYPEAMNFLQIPVVTPGYVPKMAFIDRKGVIQSQYQGQDDFFKGNEEQNIRAELDKLLKAPAKPAAKKTTKKK